MPRLIWTPAALRDLARLHAFLAAKNPDAARRAVATIRDALKVLTDHQEVGRPVENLPVEFRAWPIGFGASGYIVLYRAGPTEVAILAVRHSREAG